mmetsp:Transcript_45480/g.75908  ORF Transcript_45480/g.75908 Transcript_45480/m.75908 type:complete len:411 (+) Transcript_45480:1238-2470(+)
MVKTLTSNGGSTGHVLVTAVGAASNETSTELGGPLVGADGLSKAGEGVGAVRSGGAVDMRLELREVDLDDMVVVGALISLEKVLVLVGILGDSSTAGGLEVTGHAVVEREEGGGGSDLSAHVADGAHSCAGDRVDTRAKVLDDVVGSSRDSEDASELEDDVLGRGPSVELSSELDTDVSRGLEFPRDASHDIDSISTTDTDGDHAKTSSVGGMAVSTDHETAREGVVLKDDLVDDSASRTPEAHAVLGAGSGKELIDFLVGDLGLVQVDDGSLLGLNQVVAVDRRGDCRLGESCRDELENCHLGCCVLHRHSVWSQQQVALSPLDVLVHGVIQVGVQNLLSQRQRTRQSVLDDLEVLLELLVRKTLRLFDGAQEGRLLGRSKSTLEHASVSEARGTAQHFGFGRKTDVGL